MTFRIGWLSPLTPASGVGTFSHAVTRHFPASFGDEPIDLTILHLDHGRLYQSARRSIQIEDGENFHRVLTLFDLLIYNIGNNREHHEAIFNLLRIHPGIIICHDYVYQHYLAERSLRSGKGFASYAALLLKYGDGGAEDYIRKSRITSRTGKVRYSPWDSDASVAQPMSEAILSLGSALVVHSAFAQRQAEKSFTGPILRLGMPHDQKSCDNEQHLDGWQQLVPMKWCFHAVSFGHIQPTKCIDLTLAAIAESKTLRRKLRYTIAGFVGDTNYFQQLQDMVAAHSLRDVVSFETNVSEARLADLMREADVFINLRKPNTEGSSASLIEQLDSGKPVVVLDSGCYAEISPGAAVKLPVDATSLDIRKALEKLIGNPDDTPIIGRAGRRYARTWTCKSYAESIVRFACENRELLRRRSKATGIISRSGGEPIDGTDPWTRDLAGARLSLRYLDANVIALDPDLLLGKTRASLCIYVAQVIFGIFDGGPLLRALARFFARRDDRATYWDCVKFALIVDAVFSGDAEAVERLRVIGPCYEPEFWGVIEHLPPRQYIAAATLSLMGRLPWPDDYPDRGCGLDGVHKRLRVIELVGGLPPDAAGALARLKRWLEQTSTFDFENDLPPIERDLEYVVGSPSFRECADLSGFFAIEPDHAWTRGNRGFIGLRLGPQVDRVEIQVRHVDASAERPCSVGLSSGIASAEIEIRDTAPHWIALDIGKHLTQPAATTWLQVSAGRAAAPPESTDQRILGVCLLRLRVATDAGAVSSAPATSEAVEEIR